MPKDRPVEARHQTEHKLELMRRYWGAWCTILAHTQGKFRFCSTRLWLVDTHAGGGLHPSAAHPDGGMLGTPHLAAVAARDTQRRFHGVEVRVRATDIEADIAAELAARLAPWRGEPPAHLDIDVRASDWAEAVPDIAAEIADEGHPHGGLPGTSRHEHRSLWFVDPFGVGSIDHALIVGLPQHAEVIVNLDLMTLLRLVGRARSGDTSISELLDTVFGGGSWQAVGTGPESRTELASTFAESFVSRWPIRKVHLLRPSLNQDRAMIHLTDVNAADEAFTNAHDSALRAGTLIAGAVMTTQEKDRAADALHDMFRGLTVTTREIREVIPTWNGSQLRWICSAAQARGLGRWDDATGTMVWLTERQEPAGLWDSPS